MSNKNNVGFCANCFEKVNYTLKTEEVGLCIRNVKFNYQEQSAVCEKCGNEIYLPELNDANAKAREDAFNEAFDLINIPNV